MNKSLKHLNKIADALIKAGYEVEQPRKDCDYLDVWGFESPKGSKQRRRCFEEIYCVVFEIGDCCVSYWTTNKTHDGKLDNIEIEQSPIGLGGIDNLIASLSVQPLKRKASK